MAREQSRCESGRCVKSSVVLIRGTGRCLLVGQTAKAVFLVAASREVDERFATVRRDTQQYEQRLIWNKSAEPIERMDVRFELRVRKTFEAAMKQVLYDPDLFKIVDETMLFDGHQDWRYRVADAASVRTN